MAAREIAAKKYGVALGAGARARLGTLIHTGKHAAQRLMRPRIPLEADASEAGEAWRDSRVAAAWDTGVGTLARVRQQLAEAGFEAVLVRQPAPASARPRLFDGAAEAKLVALAGSTPPKGRKRWSSRPLEEPVADLRIVGHASDNTIGRRREETPSSRARRSNGSSRRTPAPPAWPAWKMGWTSTRGRVIRAVRGSASTRHRSHSPPERACRPRPGPGG